MVLNIDQINNLPCLLGEELLDTDRVSQLRCVVLGYVGQYQLIWLQLAVDVSLLSHWSD